MSEPRTRKPPIPACAYIRVSSVADGETFSPEQQRYEIDQYAARKGLKIVDEVRDIDESGRTFTKRQVGNVIEAIGTGKYKAVVLWKWSRWGRNTRDSLIHIAKVEKAGGIVMAATEDFDEKTTVGRFSRNQMFMIAELQSDQIGDGWKETQARRRRAGLTHSGGPRFGYTYFPKKEKGDVCRYEIDPAHAEALADAYRRYVDGAVSLRRIAIEWNEKGILNTRGRRWDDSSVRLTMDTGFAAGLIRERSEKPVPGEPCSRSMEKFDIENPGAHEPIIDLPTWEAYKARRKSQTQKPPGLREPKHAVSGLLFCACCGRRMTARYSGRSAYLNWVCARNGTIVTHDPVGTSDKKIMAAIFRWLAERAQGDPSVARNAADLARKAARDGGEALIKESATLKAKMKKLVDAWMAGRVDDENYDVQRERLKELIATTEGHIAKADDRRARRVSLTPREFAGLAVEFPQWAPRDQNAFLDSVLMGVVVWPGGATRFVTAGG